MTRKYVNNKGDWLSFHHRPIALHFKRQNLLNCLRLIWFKGTLLQHALWHVFSLTWPNYLENAHDTACQNSAFIEAALKIVKFSILVY